MSHEHELLVLLSLFYLAEGCCLLPLGTVVIRSWVGTKFSISRPSTFLGNDRLGLFLLSLFPFGKVYLCNRLPFSVSPTGVSCHVETAASLDDSRGRGANYLSFRDITSVARDGKTVFINKRKFVTVEGEQYAEHLCEFIETLARVNEEDRGKIVCDEIAQSMDVQEITDILRIFSGKSLPLKYWSSCVFVVLFVFLPGVVLTNRFVLLWPAFVVLLLLQVLVIGSLFVKLHKLYYPALLNERLVRLFTMIVMPPSLVRSVHHLSINLLAKFHPLAVANVLCDRATFVSFARSTLLDLRFPVPLAWPTVSGPESETEDWHHEHLREQIENFLLSRGFSPDTICEPPPREDAECQSYCPRCHQQFVLTEGNCTDCQGIQLVPFAASQEIWKPG